MIQFIEEKPLHLLRALSFREVAARSGNRNRLSIGTITIELDKAPRTEPSPTSVDLLNTVLNIVSSVAPGIEHFPHSGPHKLKIVGMKFGLHAFFVVKEAFFGKTVKLLRILIVYADIIRKRIAPRPHERCRHREIEALPYFA